MLVSNWSSWQSSILYDVRSRVEPHVFTFILTSTKAPRRIAPAVIPMGPPLHEGPVLIWFTVFYVLICVCGFMGNVLTIAVVRKTRDLQSNTNFFLCNLAISDLLLLISGIPSDMIYMWRTYPVIAGTWYCILKAQLSEMASNISILTILMLTIERWVAICRPLHVYVYFNRDRIRLYILLIWVIGCLSAVLLSMQFAVIPYSSPNSSIVYEHVTQCDVDPSLSIPYIFEATSIVFFILPMALIVGAYGSIIRELNQCRQFSALRRMSVPLENGPQLKARFLIIIMLITVASVFFICFLPLHIQRLMTTYDKDRMGSSHENAYFSRIWFTVAGLLHFVSAAANPIIYNLMSRRFRLACRAMILSFTHWCMRAGRCHKKKSNQHDVIDEIQIELRQGGHRSTDTTSFKERLVLWLFGGRPSRWQSCYEECQSIQGRMIPHQEDKIQQEWL